jgi:hypothetical protein
MKNFVQKFIGLFVIVLFIGTKLTYAQYSSEIYNSQTTSNANTTFYTISNAGTIVLTTNYYSHLDGLAQNDFICATPCYSYDPANYFDEASCEYKPENQNAIDFWSNSGSNEKSNFLPNFESQWDNINSTMLSEWHKVNRIMNGLANPVSLQIAPYDGYYLGDLGSWSSNYCSNGGWWFDHEDGTKCIDKDGWGEYFVLNGVVYQGNQDDDSDGTDNIEVPGINGPHHTGSDKKVIPVYDHIYGYNGNDIDVNTIRGQEHLTSSHT